jgi:V/A-type H+-transporting ATPase subunit A
MRMICEFYERADRLIAKGAPLVRIRELPCINEVIRARSTVPNDKPEGVAAIHERMTAQLVELERSYA